MKDFSTAAKRADRAERIEAGEEVRESFTFKHDDHEVTCYRPTEAQVVMLMTAEAGIRSTQDEQMAAYIDFFFAIIDEDSQAYFGRRFMDGDDVLDIGDLTEMIQEIMEEWTARPTRPSSDSTTSLVKSGDGSTESSDSEVSTSGKRTRSARAT